MKTLSQLKRDIAIGTNIICTGYSEAENLSNDIVKYGELFPVEIPSKLKKMRHVCDIRSNGFFLQGIDDDSTGSFCEWPRASELEYEGDTFTIRDLYHAEKNHVVSARTYKIIKND